MDVKEHIKKCDACQKVNTFRNVKPELHSIPVLKGSMRQIGVDITNLSKTKDGFCCVVLAVDYLTKWPEGKALKDKTAKSVARFLFDDIICRHGCPEIIINDQGMN